MPQMRHTMLFTSACRTSNEIFNQPPLHGIIDIHQNYLIDIDKASMELNTVETK